MHLHFHDLIKKTNHVWTSYERALSGTGLHLSRVSTNPVLNEEHIIDSTIYLIEGLIIVLIEAERM